MLIWTPILWLVSPLILLSYMFAVELTLTVNVAAPLEPLISFQPVSSLSPPVESQSPLPDTLELHQNDVDSAVSTIFGLSNEEVIEGMIRMTGVLGLKRLAELGDIARRKLREPSARRR